MEIFVNNIKVPFSGETTSKFFNPLFNDLSSHSYPVTFNARIPAVQRAFGFQSAADTELIDTVEGEIRSEFFNLTGLWKVTESGPDVIEAYFMPGSGSFYSLIKGKYLTEIDFGGIKYPPFVTGHWSDMLADMVNNVNTQYPDSEYAAYCAYMEYAAGADANADLKLINQVAWDATSEELSFTDGGNNGVFLFVGTVLQYLFNSNGYKIESSVFSTDPELCKVTIFNTYNIKPPESSSYWDIARIDYSKLVPYITCGDFLKALRNRFGVGVFINESSKSVNIKLFDEVVKAEGGGRKAEGKIKSLQNNRLAGMLFPLFNTDEYSDHSYKDDEDLQNATVVNKYRDIMPETRSEGEIMFVTSEQTYYKIVWEEGVYSETQRLCHKSFQHAEGNGTTEIEQLSGSLAMYTYSRVHSFYYQEPPDPPVLLETEIDMLLPRCDIKGNREGIEFNEFPLIFMSARSINSWVKPIDGEFTYPLPVLSYPAGLSDIYDASGNIISGANLSLKWNGTCGLINKLWKNRINWEMNIKKLVKATVLNSNAPVLLDMSKYVRLDKSNMLVNSFDIVQDVKNTRVENVELLRL